MANRRFLYTDTISKTGGDFMEPRTYGYARVSSREQNLDRQIEALLRFGIPAKQIHKEKKSGKDFDRPQYQRLLRRLHPGDTLVIKSIDRLGRNYSDIIEQWRVITKEKRASIVVLDMPLLDTRRDNDLTGTLIADIVLQLLSYVAQVEREYIHQRQAEGIAIAKQNGIHFGRRARVGKPNGYVDCLKLWQNNQISAREAGRRLNVNHTTFLKWVKTDTSH